MEYFVYFATFIMFYLATIWSNSNWFNVSIKFVLLCGTVWGGLLSLIQLGFVVQIPQL